MSLRCNLLLASLMCLISLEGLGGSQSVSINSKQTTQTDVYPLLRMKLTSSVLPAAIQMLTSYIERLEQIQKTLEAASVQNHHNHFTTPTPTTEDADIDRYSYNKMNASTQAPNTASSTVPVTQPPSTTVSIVTQGSPTSTTVSVVTHGSTTSERPHTGPPAIASPTKPEANVAIVGPGISRPSEEVVTQGTISVRPEEITHTTQSTKVETTPTTVTLQSSGLQSSSKPSETVQSANNTASEFGKPELGSNGTNLTTESENNASNSTHSNVEEVSIPNELYGLTTTQYEVTDIPTEASNVETTTEAIDGTTNTYELNINEETLIDIELIFGDKKDEVKTHDDKSATTSGGAKTGRRLKEDSDFKKKMKNSSVDQTKEKHKVSNNVRPVRNTTSFSNKFNQKYGDMNKNKTLVINNGTTYNKTSNIVKNTLQNILAQQRNKTSGSSPTKQKVSPTNLGSQSQPIDNGNATSVGLKTKNKLSDKTVEGKVKFGTKILENHLKESNFNKSSDEIFMETVNDIVEEQKNLERANSTENVKNNDGQDLMGKFWSLANFFQAMHNFLSGDMHLLQQASNAIAEKREENYLKNVTRQLTFLKVFYNIEAKNARLWRYHGYSKSATKFLQTTTTLPAPEQLKVTLTRLIERSNIKHRRTIEATQKFLEELETRDSKVNRALEQCSALRFT
ncbi:hypothetical protein M8J76_016827 [Diaphorina citri]|nr:hypothetical protein M8J75_004044 [Diaphorina citri]KAI5722999.1 hypothetical protein M8J76_016827 [Diaphorina citri]